MFQDVRDALRMLRASPRTTLAVWSVMTLTLAAATIVFTIVDHIVIRPLPYPNPETLITIRRAQGTAPPSVVSPQDYFLWSERARSLSQLGAFSGSRSLRLTVGGDEVPLVTQRVTHSLFATLGTPPVLGQSFGVVNETPGRDAVVILSDRVWRRYFDADPGIIGRQVTFGSESRHVVGVMPPDFKVPLLNSEAELWVPLTFRDGERDFSSGGRGYSLTLVARLAPGASVSQARQQIEAVTADAVASTQSRSWRDARPVVSSLLDSVVGPAKGWLWLALAAVGVVLLLASANIANLLLARTSARSRELAVRAALGASAARLARVALFEGILVTLAAAVTGLVITSWSLAGVIALLPAGTARVSSIAMDSRVFFTALLCASVAGLLAGLAPARLASQADVMSLLRSAHSPGRSKARAVLVVSQVGFVVVLVFATVALIGSFVKVTAVDLGFDYENRATWEISALRPVSTPGADPDQGRVASRLRDLEVLAAVEAAPGVDHAALIDLGDPFGGGVVRYSVSPSGQQLEDEPLVDIHYVTRGYLDAAGLRLVEGRFFDEAVTAGAPETVVLSEEAARRLFPNTSAVGQSVRFRGDRIVAGVVRGVRKTGPESAPAMALYVSMEQSSDNPNGTMSLMVRSDGDISRVIPAVQAALQPFVRTGLQPPRPRLLIDGFRSATEQRRFMAQAITVFGGLALFIGAFGVYGVLTSLVAQQTREFGVRLALGATGGVIVTSVLRTMFGLVAGGLAGGLIVSWLASNALSTLVFGLEPTDPRVFGVVVLVVTSAATLAAALPAFRASRVDPVIALRLD